MTEIKQQAIDNKRLIFLCFLILSVFTLFFIRLTDWQIINHEYYKLRAAASNVYYVKSDPVRGEILDCDGVGLAVNDTGYKVVLDRLLIEKSDENRIITQTVKILEGLGNSWIDILPINIENDEFCFFKDDESRVKAMKNFYGFSQESTASECMNEIIKKYNVEEYSQKEQKILCGVKYNLEKQGISHARMYPYVLAENISRDSVMVLSEKSDILKGVRIQTSLVRKYVNGHVAPHIIGYTGCMTSEEYKKLKETYPMDSLIGKTGIECAFENVLKGSGGKRVVQAAFSGETSKFFDKETSSPGNTVFLTLSSKLQKAACNSLKNNIEQARKLGVRDCNSGGVAVLDVKNFSVLAAATFPTYDLTRFTEDKSYYSQLASDSAVPLLNRAFFGAYPPGSVYKPLVACAALQEGKITPNERVSCGGSFNYYKGYQLKCMGVHGGARLIDALSKSCNVYFAELGRRLGADCLKKYAEKFGIGVKTGVEVGESCGVVAGPQHCERVGSHWYESGSSQAAIGQSDNMITPLQLASYTASIANGGHRFKTHLIKKITDYTRTKIIKEHEPELVEDLGISGENIDIVKRGMREVVVSGTARDFADYPIAIGAKTGTAQNPGSDHTTFICFAPFDDPEIAVAVVVANGKFGNISKNVARDILNAYFNIC